MKIITLGSRKILRIDESTILVVFLILMKNCLYLVDITAINIPGVFNFADMWLGLFMMYIIYVLYRYRKLKTSTMFTFIVITQIALCFIAAVQQYNLTGQSVMLGIRPQRFRVVVLFSYFAITKLFAAKKLTVKRVEDMIVKLGLFEAVISIIQQLIYNQFVFLHCKVHIRYGSVRLYLSESIIVFAIFIATSNILKKKKMVQSVVMLCAGISYLVFVTKGRWGLFSVCVPLILGYLLMKKYGRTKMIYTIGIIIAAIILIQTPIFRDLLGRGGFENQGTGDSMVIRNQGRALYLATLSVHPLFGAGYPNELYEPAVAAAGYFNNFFLNDNGIFGYAYIYGLVGVIVWIIWFLKMLRASWNIYVKNSEYTYIMYIIMLIISGYNMTLWLWYSDAAFVLIIFMCILDTLCSDMVKTAREHAV